MENIKLQWRRNQDGTLTLWVCEDNTWNPYQKSKRYRKDAPISSNSGFATAQIYVRLSKEGKINLDYLPTLEN